MYELKSGEPAETGNRNAIIILGDCLREMASIPDSSVDMILADLPYGVLNSKNASAQWDRQLPLDQLWAEFLRVAKDNAAIVLFAQGMFTATLMTSRPKLWKYNLILEKDRPTGFLNANRMPMRSHEDIAVFYDRLPTYNPQMVPCLPSERNHPRGTGKHANVNRQYGPYSEVRSRLADEKYPRSVVKIPQEHKCDGKSHPTQKPVDLCKWLIRTYTNEGDTVLDPCMGSGTAGVACAGTGRKFIGIEINEEYYNLARSRIMDEEQKISAELSQKRLPDRNSETDEYMREICGLGE